MNKLNEPMNIVFVSAMNISCINTTLELHILKVTKLLNQQYSEHNC